MSEELTIADYEKILADKRRLTRELDIALHGAGAAKQASLCDLIDPAKKAGRVVRAAKAIIAILNEFDGNYQLIDNELWDELWDATDALR